MTFETPRLLLRPFDPYSQSDVESAFAIYSDPRVVKFLSGIPTPDLKTQQERMRERAVFYASLDNGTGNWAIIEKATNSLIGAALVKQLPLSSPEFVTSTQPSQGFQPSTNPADLAAEHEIGWHLAPSRWGNGFATEAAWAMIAYGFKHLNQPVLYAVVNPANFASIAVTRRLGMRHLGRTREYYNAEVELFELLRK